MERVHSKIPLGKELGLGLEEGHTHFSQYTSVLLNTWQWSLEFYKEVRHAEKEKAIWQKYHCFSKKILKTHLNKNTSLDFYLIIFIRFLKLWSNTCL